MERDGEIRNAFSEEQLLLSHTHTHSLTLGGKLRERYNEENFC